MGMRHTSYDPKDPNDQTSPMMRMEDVGWMCDEVYPTSVQEERMNGGWIRTAMPAGNEVGDPERMFENPGPIEISGNRANSDEGAGRSVNRSQGNTGAPDNHDGEFPPYSPHTPGGY